ncbi:MAG: acyl-CoA dehydrogenase family protein, partial [Deltaproteobacteria bacterium]|nr:acyl-CoA dehydrogenase family protein [Deltaproteobacteria bacterium]
YLHDVRDKIGHEIAGRADEIDDAGHYPRDLLQALGAAGLLDLGLPGPEGTAGGGVFEVVLVVEEVASMCASTGAIVAISNMLVCDPLRRSGPGEVLGDILSRVGRGELLPCHVVSSGTDALRVRRDGDIYLIDGVARRVGGGAHADVCLLQGPLASVDSEGGDELSFWAISLDAPGIRRGLPTRDLGLRGVATRDIIFEGCRVEALRRLGDGALDENMVRRVQDADRLAFAAIALGVGRSALSVATRYARDREDLGSQQLVQFELADMATRLDAARLLTWRAAHVWDGQARDGQAWEGGAWGKEGAAMARLMAAEVASFVSGEAARLCAGIADVPDGGKIERNLRDAKRIETLMGTSAALRAELAEVLIED